MKTLFIKHKCKLFDLDEDIPADDSQEPFDVSFSQPQTLVTWRECLSERAGQIARSFFSVRNLEHAQTLISQLRPNEHARLEWIFPYNSLKASEIMALGREFPSLNGDELHDARVSIDLFPEVEVLQSGTLKDPDFSVIIPCFEKPGDLQTALRFWREQLELKPEVIVVDDGSASSWILSMVGQWPEQLTLLRLPERDPGDGDHRFRAGIARNQGLKFARSQNITFADCDILVPSDFLLRSRNALLQADVVMPQRWQLSQHQSEPNEFAAINFDRDVILSPGAFWEDFQVSATHWNADPLGWKWVSTFCLSTTRSWLDRVGAFRHSFVTYGFEDSEWGYRAWRSGARFQLMQLPTYHLPQSDMHSQFGNDHEKRTALFRISADRFFRHHPQRNVYHALKPWLS